VIVSIVIPHYERLELLKETLHTVHLQSIPNWEAIVVDDGSCDTVYRSVQQLGSDRVKISRRTTGVKGP
jgi:glycosyltransferase involved in cell wall biosynthesis